MKKILAGLLAALTSPDAVKAEKSLAALVAGRLLLFAPGVAALIAKFH